MKYAATLITNYILIMRKLILILTLNIFVLGNGMAQFFDFAKQNGYNQMVTPDDVLTDSAGNTYTFGTYSSKTDFDPGPAVYNLDFYALSFNHVFMQKLDANGNFVWAKSLENLATGQIYINGALDKDANIIITGSFQYSVDFDPGPGSYVLTAAGTQLDIFIAKYTANGDLLWAKAIGDGKQQWGSSVTADENGNVYSTGMFEDDDFTIAGIDFDPGPATHLITVTGAPTVHSDGYILKLDANGNFIWVNKIGGIKGELGEQIKYDGAGNIILVGVFIGSLDFDYTGGTDVLGVPGATTQEIFIMKTDTAGNYSWTGVTQGSCYIHFSGFDLDLAGSIYMSGYTNGCSHDLDPGPGIYQPTFKGNDDAFIYKLNSAGTFQWGKSFTTITTERMGPIDVEDNGDFLVAGWGVDSLDLDAGPGTLYIPASVGGYNTFLQKYDSVANLKWTIRNVPENVNAIARYQNDDIYILGGFQLLGDFDPGPGVFTMDPGTVGAGIYSSYLLKLSEDSCNMVTILFDSTQNVECSSLGYAASHTVFGIAPYAYAWDVSPIVTAPILYTDSSGIFTVHVTDAAGCTDERTVLISGAKFMSGYDLATIFVNTSPQSGGTAHLTLSGINYGCDTVSGSMYIVLDTSVNYLSSTPTASSISGDTLIWDFPAMDYSSGTFNVNIDVFINSLAGDSLWFKTGIDPTASDMDTSNNEDEISLTVVGSYDPNIKSVLPAGVCDQHYVNPNQRMTYTVMFQNTGNAPALNIYIIDPISSGLNITTLSVIDQSDVVMTEILPGNVLKFKFDNINLPDSTSDEPGSHGYVVYQIDQMPGLPDGTMIENTAAIYFDLNPAVVTNTVSNTIANVIPSCSSGLGTNTMAAKSNNVLVYPNPANSSITISTEKTIAQRISLLDVYGRTIKTVQPNSSSTTMDLQNLENGIYFVGIVNENWQQTVKIVKQ